MQAIVAESHGPSHIDALVGVALQIPARHVALPGKKGVGAGLHFWRIEDELGFAALLRDGVVGCDHDLSKGLAIGCYAMAKYGAVDCVGQGRHGDRGGDCDEGYSFQDTLDSWA
jgi:hypothetical protein